MIDPRKQFTPEEGSQETENWEQLLQAHREKLKQKPEPNIQQSAPTPIIKSKPQIKESIATNKEVLGQYLEQWQIEHNISVDENKEPQDAFNSADSDTNVVLVEEWIDAQHSLQGEVSLEGVQKVSTVWYNPKHKVAETASPITESETPTQVVQSVESIPVSINVLEPKLINSNQPVICLSEKELIERLNKRLLPHLTDSVNGMVRVAIQRHTAGLTFALQQHLAEETPNLVSDILNYNLKSVLAEIKRDLKFKNKP